MKLTGPPELNACMVIEGVQYIIANGSITPEIPDDLVPDTVYALGFYRATAAIVGDDLVPPMSLRGNAK